MAKPIFKGVCTALVTPFRSGEIDYETLDRLLRRQMEANIPAIVLSGTTGEAPTLSIQEKIALFRRGKRILGDSCRLIAGTGSNSTAEAIALSQAAESVGADALLVVTPYYNKATEAGLLAHFTAIADRVKIPMILYNIPTRTGVNIPVSVYKVLSKHPNICGVKEASGDLAKIARIQNECEADFFIWSGCDELAAATMALGGEGVISVLSNVAPKQTVEMAEAALGGNFRKAGHLQCGLMPLIDLLFCEVNPIPVKAAMKYLGLDCGTCRLPLTELSEEHRQNLLSYLSLHKTF